MTKLEFQQVLGHEIEHDVVVVATYKSHLGVCVSLPDGIRVCLLRKFLFISKDTVSKDTHGMLLNVTLQSTAILKVFTC